MLTSDREVFVCYSHQPRVRVTILIDIRFNGLLEASAVLIHQERAYVNLNRSTHMNKRLDCEDMQLFDSNLNQLHVLLRYGFTNFRWTTTWRAKGMKALFPLLIWGLAFAQIKRINRSPLCSSIGN